MISILFFYILNFLFQVSNKGFQIKLQQRINILVFEPPFKSFREVLIGMIDSIVDGVMDIPRLESKLYLDWGKVEMLKVSINSCSWVMRYYLLMEVNK